ncbi:hypothetical protein JM79_2766 [Gramella sp. Hel_I_59]|uniref:hypothetical protein n=1 Tax=Gramella sp. Hel_I_59 TaxID=1249978 RepID=UPI0011526E65|nr:hypothetical protein [Gramella sp. Hel_I_59]TQI71817.1 hypothetical protein JM79_2766 [Gramella sp. Hel_I_59]
MKKLFTLAFLLAFSLTTFAQEPPDKAVDLDTVTIDFQVTDISGDVAKIISTSLGKKYEVPATPEYNPFGYVLEVDREYTICLERDMNLVYKYQTRGQTKTLPARMIWFTVSDAQLKKDQVQLSRFISEPPGYDRSPRY